MDATTALYHDPSSALEALFSLGADLFQLKEPPVDAGTVIDPYLTEFGGVDTLPEKLQILALTTDDDVADTMRGRLHGSDRRVVRSRFVNYPDLEADVFVSCPPTGNIEAANINYTVAEFGEWGSSSRAPLAPAVVESAFKGAREMAMFVLPETVIYDESYERLTSLGRAHIRPAFEISDPDSGYSLVGFYIHDKDCPPPVFGNIEDREEIVEKWTDKGWPGAIDRAWTSISERMDQLTVPDLSEASQKPSTIRADDAYNPVEDRIRIALDGGGNQIRFIWNRPVAHLKLQKALKICGWMRDQKSKREVPLLELESRARRLVRNEDMLDRLVGALEAVGLRVEVDNTVYEWLDNERIRLERQEVPFEQTIWNEGQEEWMTLHEEEGLTSEYPDLYEHYRERIEDEIPWPLWEFQKKDLARLLMKDNAMYAAFMGAGKSRQLLSYIWLRQGERNLVVLESKLIDELIHEAEKIGFPVDKINVIDEHEKAKPENLKWLNVATYTRIWRSVDGRYRTRETEGWKVEIEADGETRVREFEEEDDIPNHYIENPDATVRKDTIEVDGPPCKSQAHLLRKTRFNALFFDEAHNLKGGKTTKQAQYAQLLRAKHTILMSGTIVKSYPRNIYALLVQAFGEQTPENYWAYDVPVLHPDGDYCTSGTRVFREKFVQVEYFSPKFDNTLEDGKKGREIPMVPEEKLPEWRSMLAPKILRRHRREPEVERAIKIPDADFEVVEVDIGENHAKFYGWWFHRFKDWFMEQLERERRNEGQMNAARILAQLNKLQFAATIPQSDKVQASGHQEWDSGLTRKQKRLIDEMERIEEEGKKAIVFSERPGLLDYLKEHLDRAGIDAVVFHGDVGIDRRIDRKNRFRNDEACTVLLMSRECGNTGYNLPEADEVWSADWSWTPDKMTQAEKRMLRSDWVTKERQESNQNPVIRRLVQKGTIDEYMRQLVETKSEGISEAIDYQESDFDPTEWMSFRDFSLQMFEDKGIDLESL